MQIPYLYFENKKTRCNEEFNFFMGTSAPFENGLFVDRLTLKPYGYTSMDSNQKVSIYCLSRKLRASKKAKGSCR